MKELKFTFLLLLGFALFPSLTFAQRPAQKPYETIAPEDKLLADYDKKFPGYCISKDGTKTDCLILFENGDKINNPDVKLTTSLSHAGENVMVDKANLKAFYVNNRLYKPMVVIDKQRWVHLKNQGAIRVVMDASFNEKKYNKKLEFWYDKVNGTNVGYWDTLGVMMPYWSEAEFIQKLDKPVESVFVFNRKNMLKFVGDYEELAAKISNKEEGYKNSLMDLDYSDRMFGIYNKWYDEQNPDAIEYFPETASFVAPDKPIAVAAATEVVVEESSEVAAKKYQEEIKAAAEEAHRAPRIDPFKGRPSTASAAVASAKPEVAVKKQSFKDRLARIKSDGNKVGILVTSKNLLINPGSVSEGTTKANVMGSYGPIKGIDKIAETTADELNKGFGTDVFEAVDYSKIPVKKGKYGKMDDWWSTKYKVIFIYEIEPRYTAIYITNSETGEREFQAKMHAQGEIIVMSAEEIKPEKLKYVTSSPKTWGYYNSEKYIGSKETDFNTIQELKAAINPPSDEVVVDAIIESQKADLAKFIKKKSK